jgi:DNA-binding NarL/FixJ family response regulator
VSSDRRCLVIDDHPLIRIGARGLLNPRYEVEEASDLEGGLQMLTDFGDFDLAIVEMRGPGRGLAGTSTIRALRERQPGLPIIALGERPERHLAREAVDAGASAYVVKSSASEEFEEAVEAASQEKTFVDPAVPARRSRGAAITKRQQQILQLMSDGHSTATIAKRLGLSTETVKTHTKRLLARLEARDRAHAVAIALRNALIE